MDETCIEYIYIENKLEEIACKLDLRSLTKEKLNLLVEYVKEIDAMLLVEDSVYLSNVEDILEIMKKSKANKFFKNPLAYFSSIN